MSSTTARTTRSAALAAHEYYKATEQARRQAEQATVEASAEFQIEVALHDLETSLTAIDRIFEAMDERDALRSCGILV